MEATTRKVRWGVEIGLGAWGQEKQSSRIIKSGFLTREDARSWAEQQDKDSWGNWDVVELWY